MNAVKSRGYAKKLVALVMAMAMVFSLAVSASAVNAGTYTPSLSVSSSVPHTLDFFADNTATVSTDGETDTVQMELKNPATVTVTKNGNSYTASGEITSATATAATIAAGYTVSLVDDILTVTCPHDVETFAPVITFTVSTSATNHRAVDATLTLSAPVE